MIIDICHIYFLKMIERWNGPIKNIVLSTKVIRIQNYPTQIHFNQYQPNDIQTGERHRVQQRSHPMLADLLNAQKCIRPYQQSPLCQRPRSDLFSQNCPQTLKSHRNLNSRSVHDCTVSSQKTPNHL
jgi:hypothetical protein